MVVVARDEATAVGDAFFFLVRIWMPEPESWTWTVFGEDVRYFKRTADASEPSNLCIRQAGIFVRVQITEVTLKTHGR